MRAERSMQEETVFFESGGLRLHGMLSQAPSAAAGVVICHPHPMYGGTMDNNVVMAIAQAFQ